MKKTITPGTSQGEMTYSLDGEVVATMWHSDKGEWTVATPDGAVYRERGRTEAEDRCDELVKRRSEQRRAWEADRIMVADLERDGLL